MPKSLLITGGAGFIGSNFIKYWLSKYKQDKIINLDKLTYAGNLNNLTDIASNHNYTFAKGDICDKNLVNELMKNVEYVVHFAAESHVDNSIKDSTPFVVTNVLGTQTLLDAAIRNNIKKFHHVSTDEVFGELSLYSKNKFSEKTPYSPRSPYAASKAASDHLVKSYFYTHNLPVTISNCSNNFGPYQNEEKFIPKIIANALAEKKLPIYGDGKYVRDWLFVEDHCRAIDLILEKGESGETYCIGGQSKKQYNNLEIVKLILKILEKDERQIEFVTDRPGHDRKYAVNWEKINKKLGWTPQFNFETQLKQTVDWYSKNSKL